MLRRERLLNFVRDLDKALRSPSDRLSDRILIDSIDLARFKWELT